MRNSGELVGSANRSCNRWRVIMTWVIPTERLVQIHVILSLIAMASGVAVVYGLLSGKLFARLTAA
jgi:hypothetical protein